MKSYRTILDKVLTEGGLNPHPGGLNTPFLYIAQNVRLTKTGLEGYLPDIKNILDPDISFVDSVTGLAVTITNRWPFPQLFLTDVGIHIGALEGLFFVQQTTPTKVLYSYGTGAVTWPWSCANIDQVPAFTSGDVLVYFDHNTNAYVVKNYA